MASRRWVGGAPAVSEKWTLTVAGVWASGDWAQVTIGVKDMRVTLGASASTVLADIAQEIVNAFNATSNATPGTGYTWNFGGQEYLEFRELIATRSGDTVILTAVAAYKGVPITVSSTETTAGTGAVVAVNTTPATGPNHLDNADNYLGGVLPVDDDTLYFDTGAVSCLYGLTYFRTGNIDLNVYVTNDWTGQLGLPAVNVAGTYAEYRQRQFQFRGGSKNLQILPGLLGNTAVGNVYIDLQDQAAVAIAISANRGSSTASPTIYLNGAHAATLTNTLTILAGAVSIEPDDAPTDPTKYAYFTTLRCGTLLGAPASTAVLIGANARLSVAGCTLTVLSGTVRSYAATSTVNPALVRGGTLTLLGSASCGAVSVWTGGTLDCVGGFTITSVTLHGGAFEARNGAAAGSPGTTTFFVHAGSSIYDPSARFVGNVSLIGCTIGQLAAISLPANMNYVATNL